jgi:hypothetical protein
MGTMGWRAIAIVPLLSIAALCQATQVSGSFGGIGSLNDEVRVSFTCTLAGSTCTGVGAIHERPRECSNYHDSDATLLVISGMDLASAHAIQGSISITHSLDKPNPTAGVCAYNSTGTDTHVLPYTGQWDGVGRGTLRIDGLDDDMAPYTWTGSFSADIAAAAAVFPMTVTGSVTTVANIAADIQFPSTDIGKTASVYVFALAPATVVRGASAPSELPGVMAKGGKADTPVACVLAQLNASGQLQQVSASGMQAYVTGVLSSQGQAITVLNGVPTVQIAGATFFVGYGPNSATMLNSGVNRSVVTAPAAQTCQPQPPQTGWWWNTSQGGRGFSLEVRGNSIFFASYLYDDAGRPVWLAAAGATSLDGSLFSGRLTGYSGGQTLDGAWHANNSATVDNGAVTLSFNDASHSTLVWPGGSIALERFDIAAVGGHSLAPLADQPESGWWWNPQEGGRGFFLEWQGASAFVAGYMYDAAGSPIWYASLAATPNMRAFQGNWTQYAHGQTLTGPYQPAGVAISNVAPVTITFTGADSAVMTLPGGRTTALTRFRF